MFAVSSKWQDISPHCMRFDELWLYDLTPFHDFWRTRARSHAHLAIGKNAWHALLAHHQLHLFSPLQNAIPFALAFHKHHRHEVSAKNIQKTFGILLHLGLHKCGHLRRLSLNGLQKRFGVPWARFFRGLMTPESAPWEWRPHRVLSPLIVTQDFDYPTDDGLWILAELKRHLERLSEEAPFFGVRRLSVKFHLYDQPDLPCSIDIDFAHAPFLKKDASWIYKILEERLLKLALPERVEKVSLHFEPAPPPKAVQLSLFQNEAEASRWRDLVQKLENEKFNVFVPETTPSYLPEHAWRRASPLRSSSSFVGAHGLHRPLLQYPPKAIAPPEGRVEFLERLAWFDEEGKRHQRDYFRARITGGWAWIYRNEKREWFRQGLLE